MFLTYLTPCYQIGPAYLHKDRGGSERVSESKETICLYIGGFEIKALSYKYLHQMLQRGQVVGGLLSSSSSSSTPASGPQ